MKIAFLYNNINKNFYIKKLKSQKNRSNRVYLLNKVLYELKQALYMWFFTFALFFKNLSFFFL